MTGEHVSAWFGEYLEAFAACGRGESGAESLLAYYGVPLVVTTDHGCHALGSEDQVLAVAQQQIDGMLAEHYDHSDLIDFDVAVLNEASAIYRGEFSRVRGDGSEINRLTLSYLVTDGPVGPRISALALHGAGKSRPAAAARSERQAGWERPPPGQSAGHARP